MNDRTRGVLEAYADNGGSFTEEVFPDVDHLPHVEHPERFRSTVVEFLSA